MKYVYPGIFICLENGEYSVKVPDLPGCVTSGKNLFDVIEMVQDAVSMWLCDAEDNNENIPSMTSIFDIHCNRPEFVSIIAVDTLKYRNKTGSEPFYCETNMAQSRESQNT